MATDIRSVGVVGAGTMGSGIAQVALEAGRLVTIHDPDAKALTLAFERISEGVTRRAAKAGHATAWADDILERLEPTATLDAAITDSDLVIEAVIEDLSAKRTLFEAIAATAPSDAILATNTSALSVTAIAESTPCPGRVIGLHFFNPAPVMRLVEVVATASADRAVVERAMALMAAWGKTPVRCADSPGFIVNRVNRPFTIQALRLVESGQADVPGIDAALRAAGFPMGPFELMDLIGIDINLAAARGVWDGLGRPDRLRPSPIQEALVAAGHLGRKSGEGFYRYDDGRIVGSAPLPGVSGPPVTRTPPLSESAIAEEVLGAIDDEARLAEAAGIATAADIRVALELGAGHPADRPSSG